MARYNINYQPLAASLSIEEKSKLSVNSYVNVAKSTCQ